MTHRHTTSVRRLAALVAGIMAGVGALAAPAALATNPEPTKLAFSGSFADPDFCGTAPRWPSTAASTDALQRSGPGRAEFWLTLRPRTCSRISRRDRRQRSSCGRSAGGCARRRPGDAASG